MLKRIMLKFRKFGRIEQLQLQRKQITEIVYLKQENRFIIYLITEENHWEKPTYENLFKAFINLKTLCEENH
jgi:hypothetical protein